MFPKTKIGQYYKNPETAIRLYFGCQSQQTSLPFIFRLRWSKLRVFPVKTSQRTGLPVYEGARRYLLSGEIEQFEN